MTGMHKACVRWAMVDNHANCNDESPGIQGIPILGAAWLAVITHATTYMTYYIVYNKKELEGVIYRLQTNSIFKSKLGRELAKDISAGQLWKVIDTPFDLTANGSTSNITAKSRSRDHKPSRQQHGRTEG